MTTLEQSTREVRPSLWRTRWAAIGAAIAVSLGAGGGFFAAQALPGPTESTLVPVTPTRVLDTRDPTNLGLAGPFVSAVSQKLKVTGSIPTANGTQVVVPQGASGVLLNVTAVAPAADGFVSIRPGNVSGAPSTSSLNVTAGSITPNSVQVAVPTSGANAGRIDITYDAYGVVGPTTDILIDVVGYTTNAGLQQLVMELQQHLADTDPLFATVHGPSGTILNGVSSGLVSITKNAVGDYTLAFNRRVENCVVVTSDLIWAGHRDVSADQFAPAGNNTVRVKVTSADGVYTDTTFHIIVQCPRTAAAPLVVDDLGDTSPND